MLSSQKKLIKRKGVLKTKRAIKTSVAALLLFAFFFTLSGFTTEVKEKLQDYAEQAIDIAERYLEKSISRDKAISSLKSLEAAVWEETKSDVGDAARDYLDLWVKISVLKDAIMPDEGPKRDSLEFGEEYIPVLINELRVYTPQADIDSNSSTYSTYTNSGNEYKSGASASNKDKEEDSISLAWLYWGLGIFGFVLLTKLIILIKEEAAKDKVKREVRRLQQERAAIAMEVSRTRSLGEYQTYIDNLDGWQFEQFVADWLRFKGWQKVEVTPGSGDFGADIIAYSPDGEKYAIQCKKHDKPIGIKAIQEVVGAQKHYRCECAAVVSTTRYTPAAQQLANECDVLLMNIP